MSHVERRHVTQTVVLGAAMVVAGTAKEVQVLAPTPKVCVCVFERERERACVRERERDRVWRSVCPHPR